MYLVLRWIAIIFLFVCFWKDTFELYQIINGTKKLVPLDGKGISWWTDYNIKYRNPSSVNGSFAKAFDGN